MLYPRKMDEVLWHSTTWRFSKSILVKRPRLPTIRVIGSQFISTRFRFLLETSLVGAVTVLIDRSFWILSRLSGGTRWSAPRADGATWVLCSQYSGLSIAEHEPRGHKHRPQRSTHERPAVHP